MALTQILDFSARYREFIGDISRRMPTQKEIGRGKCFGTSLAWATEALKEIAGDNKSLGLLTSNSNFDKLLFVGANTQETYRRMLEEHGLKTLVSSLNNQESFLYKRSHQLQENKKKYKLIYSMFANEKELHDSINKLIKGRKGHVNQAISLCTRLANPITIDGVRTYCAHQTVLINITGECYFFDINRGVFRVGENTDFSAIAQNISLSSGLGRLPLSLYRFAPGMSFSIKIS